MWLFAWLTTQQYFKDLTNEDMRKKMFAARAAMVESELPPLPMIASPMVPASRANSFVMDGALWSDAIPGRPDPHNGWYGRFGVG